MSLQTPTVIRTLQRKLYRKAKERKVLHRRRLRPKLFSVCLTMKPVGEPDAGDRHVTMKPVGEPDAGDRHVRVPGCMDRPRTTIARSETAQWFSPGVLEHTGRRWREDARARLNVIGGPSERPLEVPRCCAQRAEPQPSRVSRSQGPLEISGEIGNYILADFPMSLRE